MKVRGCLLAGTLALAVALIPSSVSAADRGFGAGTEVERHRETGKVRFVGTRPEQPITVASHGSPSQTALSFLSQHERAFGLRDADSDLRVGEVNGLGDGRSSVRLQQVYRGVPILAGELIVNLDADDNVLSVSGETEPFPRVDTDPGIGAAEAADTAVATTAKEHGIDAGELEASAPKLAIFDSRLLGGPGLGVPALVYRTEVVSESRADIRQLVLVEAERGGVALSFNQVAEALNRLHCNANNTASDVPCVAPYDRTETSGPSADSDVNDAFTYTGDTYDFFFDRFGRDSLDGAGMTLVSTTKYCDPSFDCPYANAFWNGDQMVYGQGLETDDIVGHELGHGLMDHTAALLYYYQSGAINESLSDVWGEFIDLTNGADLAADRWKLGEDISESHFVGTCSAGPELRNMKDPTLCGLPDRMSSSFYHGDTSDNGGVHINSGVNNKAVYLMTDGASFNGQTVSAIGLEKVAAIYYELQTNLLTSGADYADLADALRQACSTLTGTDGITAANCAEVNKAILAVEMDEIPAAAPNPEAPVCDGTDNPTNFFSDDMESGTGWTKAGTWDYTTGYATSGILSLYTPDPETLTDASIVSPAMTVPATIPAGGAFLRFAHGFGFEEGSWDGGVVEYSTNGGTSWTDAAALFTHNGYNGSITPGDNPLGDDRPAFVEVSNGYISSRLNLASLAGQTVKFRFHFGSDSAVGAFPGWAVDDVRGYTCAAGGDTTPPETTITSGPSEGETVNTATPTFAFNSSEGGSSFECKVDSAAFAACSSPRTIGPLADGSHTFRVRATDSAGNPDASPATRTFTVNTEVGDSDPPETMITTRPNDVVRIRRGAKFAKVRYGVSSDEVDATIEARINGTGWQGPFGQGRIVVSRLKAGRYTVDFRARDAADNLDPTPARDKFRVKKRRR